MKLHGTGVALVTPFKNGAVDYTALEKIIEHCIDGGVEFLVSMGTTGESVTLSKEEKQQVVDFSKEKINGRVGFVVGIGGNNTAVVLDQIKSFNFDGVDAILSVSPAYNKPTQEGIYQHFMAVAEACPVDIIIYNVPGRTSSNVSAATTLRLAHANKKFIAVKEASGNLAQCMDIAKGRPRGFLLLSGDDNLTLPMIACGGDGVISVVANAYPAEFSDMVRAARANDMNLARDLHYRLMDLTNLLFAEGNPAGVKANLNILGLCEAEVRLPLVSASAELYDALKAEAAKVAEKG
jgi:4-hydroxy-tetrahydrodipicolinate synthase